MMADTTDTILYYKELLLYQYINKTKARDTIGLLVSQAICDLLPIDLRDAFNIDTCIGSQLDILGEYIGINRFISVTPSKTYLIFADQDSLPDSYCGLTDYQTDANAEYYLYSYVVTKSISSLTDDEYRQILKIKLIQNTNNHSLKSINDLLYMYFNTNISILDLMNMAMVFITKDEYKNITKIAQNLNILPKPMGVYLTGVFTETEWNDLWILNSYSDSDQTTEGFSDYSTGESDAVLLDSTTI